MKTHAGVETLQLSLFDTTIMPKNEIREVKDKHPKKAKQVLYSHAWCSTCNRLVFMPWIIHGVLKRCPHCGAEYQGWKSAGDKNDSTL